MITSEIIKVAVMPVPRSLKYTILMRYKSDGDVVLFISEYAGMQLNGERAGRYCDGWLSAKDHEWEPLPLDEKVMLGNGGLA